MRLKWSIRRHKYEKAYNVKVCKNNNNNNYNNNSNLPKTMKYWVGVQRGIVCLMGGRDSLAFAGNPPSDGVTIKILVGENLTVHTSSNERMSNTEFNPNNVNDTGAFCESAISSRCPVDQQCRPGHHPATAELKKEELRMVEGRQQMVV